MRDLLQKMINRSKNMRNIHRLLIMKLGCIIIASSLFAFIPGETIHAASGIRIYDYTTKKETTYTDKQVLVTVNGTSAGKKQTPGILSDGVALVPYNDIFEKSAIGADCVYNKEKSTVSISKYGITINMKIGSKQAQVNGKTVALPVAPKRIKYINAGIIKVLVPSRFVSETLKLGYTWNSSSNTVAIVKSSLQLSYNNGNKFEYTGTQGFVTVDGKKISPGNMPSIITNNTAMLRAKQIFADSTIDATYSFNKADKSITLTRKDMKLVMTIGSKVAYLNGIKKVLDTAPLIVTNHEKETSYVMVPGSFTATSLGYNYSWDSSKRTSIITSKKTETIPPAELGDSGDVKLGKTLFEWNGDTSSIAKSSEIHSINQNAASNGNTGFLYSVNRDYSNVNLNSETYAFAATKPFNKVTSDSSDNKISIYATDMNCSDQIYQIYGISGNLVNTINTLNNSLDSSSSINLEVLPELYTYDIRLSEDKMILYVTVTINSVTTAKISTDEAGDYLTLTGVEPLNVSITEQSGYVYIDLPYTSNTLGELYQEISGSKYIKLFYTMGFGDRTRIILGINQGYRYFTSDDKNQYTISFLSPDAVEQPDIPVIIDKSTYEIVIPKSGDLNKTAITDEDDYFNNRFKIILAGDYTNYFSSNPITWNSNVIKAIAVSLNSKQETEILITTTKLQGYEYVMDDQNIYVNIGDPKEIYKNIVVLDPGHGGPAKGAQYFGFYEKDINLKILYTIGKKYFNSNPSKLKVYFTRTTDVDMTLSERAAFANKYGADLFVSLHMNASTSPAAYGTEVFYCDSNNSPNASGLTSKKLATIMSDQLHNSLATYNRGVKSEKYTVIYRNTVPAILIELGFLSNKNEMTKLTDPVYQENAVKVIYDTLCQVFEAYPTGR
jgi:N-acetylmuramoyl-L-alanine amidase